MRSTFAAERLTELEVGAMTGAAYGEKDPARRAQRNGCRDQDRETRAGTVELRIPKPRKVAGRQLDAFEEEWVGKYPSIAPTWRRAWAEFTPFCLFGAAIRNIINTTSAVDPLNRVLRKTLKTKGSFPTREAATKLVFLAICNFEKGGRAVREWVAARNQLSIMSVRCFDA